MLTITELLAAAREADKANGRTGSMYSTSAALGWTRQVFESISRGERRMQDHHVVDVARFAGIDPAYALACVHAEQSEGSVTHPAWMRVAEVLEAAERAA